jgi:hypothetical protein
MDEEEEAAAMPDANGDGLGGSKAALRQHVEDVGPGGVGQVLADAGHREGTEEQPKALLDGKRLDHVAPNEPQVTDTPLAKLVSNSFNMFLRVTRTYFDFCLFAE